MKFLIFWYPKNPKKPLFLSYFGGCHGTHAMRSHYESLLQVALLNKGATMIHLTLLYKGVSQPLVVVLLNKGATINLLIIDCRMPFGATTPSGGVPRSVTVPVDDQT